MNDLPNHRWRRPWTWLAALGLAGLLLAGCASPPPLPARPDVPHGAGLLWQVDKTGQEPSFIFGTMHVSDREIRDVAAPVEEAFARATQAAFELVSEEDRKKEELKLFVEAAVLSGKETLAELLDDETYAQLLRIAADRRPSRVYLGKIHLSRFKPWFAMMVVSGFDDGPRSVSPFSLSLDDWLEDRAKKEGKRVVGLETVDEQLAVFNGMTLGDQVALLKERLDDYDNWYGYRTSKELYLSGDTAMFYGILQRQLDRLEPGVAARFAERFLNGRNRIMVERALPLMEKGSTFVAVGALHLPGEEGLLSLLEQEGYTVTRLH